MKVNGRPLSLSVREAFPLAPGVEVTIEPLPITFRAELLRRIPPPVAPVQVVTDDAGKPQRYGGNGPDAGRPIIAPNVQARDYLVKLEEHQVLELVAGIHEGTRRGGSIEWGTEEPAVDADAKTWRAFYRAARDELVGAGVPMGRLVACGKRIAQLTGIQSDEVDELAAAFTSPPDQGAQDPEAPTDP